MGQFVIAVFKPKSGKEEILDLILREHVPTLQKLGLATDKPAYIMKSKNGTIVEVFEWVSPEAIEKAHSHLVVLEMWKEFEVCCDYEMLNNLDESKGLFAEFEPIE